MEIVLLLLKGYRDHLDKFQSMALLTDEDNWHRAVLQHCFGIIGEESPAPRAALLSVEEFERLK